MADVTPATNATNSTRYYNLPIFISTDRPSWLVDWNGAMNEIDTILNDIAITSESASSSVATIQTQVDTLSTTVQNLNTIVETAVTDVASMQTTVEAQELRLDTVESDLITQNNLVKTLSDTVVAMQATVSTLSNRVSVVEESVTAMGVNVEAIQTALTGLRSDVNSLDTRVTALENGGSDNMELTSFERYEYEDNTHTVTINETGKGKLHLFANGLWNITHIKLGAFSSNVTTSLADDIDTDANDWFQNYLNMISRRRVQNFNSASNKPADYMYEFEYENGFELTLTSQGSTGTPARLKYVTYGHVGA